MANVKITDLTAYTDPVSTDVLPIVDVTNDLTKKVSIANLLKNASLGTAALPGVAFDGDPNTGIYSPGADQVAISSNSAERIRIGSTGTVNIVGAGTAGSTQAVSFNGSAPVNSLVIDSSGRLGVGTSSPVALLDVRGNVYLAGNGTSRQTIAAVTTGGSFETGVEASTGGAVFTGSSAYASVIGTQNATPLQFGSNGAIRATLDSSGRLGLGTSTVSDRLEISNGTNDEANALGIRSGRYLNSSQEGAQLKFYSDTTSPWLGTREVARISTLGLASDHRVGSLAFALKTTNSASNPTELMRLTPTGLGIGVSPSYKLHVAGAANISGTTYLTSGNQASPGYIYINSAADDSDAYLRAGSSAGVWSAVQVTGNWNGSSNTGGKVAFHTGGSERARIDSSGRLLVGTSSYSDGATLVLQGNSTNSNWEGILRILRNISNPAADNDLGAIIYGAGSAQGAQIKAVSDAQWGTNDYPTRLVFSTTPDGSATPVERMRITQGGWAKISNTGSYNNVSGAFHEARSDQNFAVWKVTNSIGSGYIDAILVSEFTGYAPNNTTARFLYCGDNAAERCTIRSNGGIANFSANNVNLSDRNFKKDISPAAATWGCLKEWEIVNFRYKDQPDDADLNMGVIAQQVAESCPEVITVFQEAKEATEDQPAQEERIGVKEQQMMWMAIKALQEAQLRIETLEAEVAALKGA